MSEINRYCVYYIYLVFMFGYLVVLFVCVIITFYLNAYLLDLCCRSKVYHGRANVIKGYSFLSCKKMSFACPAANVSLPYVINSCILLYRHCTLSLYIVTVHCHCTLSLYIVTVLLSFRARIYRIE